MNTGGIVAITWLHNPIEQRNWHQEIDKPKTEHWRGRTELLSGVQLESSSRTVEPVESKWRPIDMSVSV